MGGPHRHDIGKVADPRSPCAPPPARQGYQGQSPSLGGRASAAECPPGKTRLDGSGQQAGPTMPKDVTDEVVASIPLVEETEVGVNDRLFRLRRLEIKPGGVSLGTAMPTGRRSFTSSRERLPNTATHATRRWCT